TARLSEAEGCPQRVSEARRSVLRHEPYAPPTHGQQFLDMPPPRSAGPARPVPQRRPEQNPIRKQSDPHVPTLPPHGRKGGRIRRSPPAGPPTPASAPVPRAIAGNSSAKGPRSDPVLCEVPYASRPRRSP